MKKYVKFVLFVSIILGVSYISIINTKIQADAKTIKEINVCMYGVVGDGITDNTKAIDDVLKKYAGKEIYFPAGVYLVSGKLNIYSDTIIRGDGINSKIIAIQGKEAGTEIFQIKSQQNIQIKEICVSGNSIVNNGEQYSDIDGIHLFDMWDVKDIEIKGCYFIDNIYAAVRIFGGSDIEILDTSFLNVDCGVLTLGDYDVSNLTVNECLFKGHNWSEAISLYGRGSYENIYLYNNVIEDKISGHGILINDQSNNKNINIRNNIISNCAVAISTFEVDGGTITNNIVNRTTSGRGIEVYGCKDVVVQDNIIADTNFDSLSIKNCEQSEFIGNNIIITSNAKNKDMAGIKVLEVCNNVVIANNTIQRVGESLNKYSISVKGIGKIEIYENDLYDIPVYISSESQGTSYME